MELMPPKTTPEPWKSCCEPLFSLLSHVRTSFSRSPSSNPITLYPFHLHSPLELMFPQEKQSQIPTSWIPHHRWSLMSCPMKCRIKTRSAYLTVTLWLFVNSIILIVYFWRKFSLVNLELWIYWFYCMKLSIGMLTWFAEIYWRLKEHLKLLKLENTKELDLDSWRDLNKKLRY